MPAPLHESVVTAIDDPVGSIIGALDLQTIGDGRSRWMVHVLGVHTDGRDRWIQIAPRPDGAECIILKLSPWATPRHALAALAALPSAERGRGTIVPVMHTV